MLSDPRRSVPSTDLVLSDARLLEPLQRLGRPLVRSAVRATQDRVRSGAVDPDRVVDDVLDHLPAHASTLRPVLNATGVILHTNLGRASLSPAARAAMVAAAGYVDVEYDLATGGRARRGRGALAALRLALPDAGDVLVVNNGAAALLLAVTALAQGREVVWSRGEMVEIGDGFRLPDLVACAGVTLREVGTTNRTVREDYIAAVGKRTGCILKVHPSNFRMAGFTAAVPVAEVVGLGVPVVVDVGSGLLDADPLLADEPDIATALRAGADVVTASGDKLLGGPQTGILAGRAELIARLRRHPMARALRVDKLTLAALEATLAGPPTPTAVALRADAGRLCVRAQAVAVAIGPPAQVVASEGAVGGGSAPGVALPGWAVSLPEHYAAPLRTGTPAVVARVERSRCLLDLRCVPADQDGALIAAVLACR
jgi:L-seryl-tRNA(Ser) seleniumtransferase